MSPQPADTILRSINLELQSTDWGRRVFDRLGQGKRLSKDTNEDLTVFPHRKLGEILVLMHLLTPTERKRVLARQLKTGDPFGECALRLKLITPKQLKNALSAQFAYQFPISGSFPESSDMVMAQEPFGAYGEAMRTVANRLMSRWWTPTRKALTVSSTEPRDGRSHVAANLALTFAQIGRRTLLVDADLRRPRQHKIFGVPHHPGLSRMLCGFVPDEVVRPVSSLNNLSLITAGPTPPNVIEVLSRAEFRAFLHHAQEHFDIVILDTPCVTGYIDALIIAESVGSALVVASKGRTRVKAIHALREGLAAKGVTLAGILMNQV